jgi:hypothetical protein
LSKKRCGIQTFFSTTVQPFRPQFRHAVENPFEQIVSFNNESTSLKPARIWAAL